MASVVVFDMGGVLFDFQGDRLIAENSRRARRWRSEEVQKIWLPLVLRFETGGASEAEFCESVIGTYQLELAPHAFRDAFRAAAVGFYEGALDLVHELRQRHRVVSLSNTNAIQWPEVLAGLGAADAFHAHFPSHLLGYHKPDPRAFAAVAAAHESGTTFYFLDDRAQNVAAAAELGWQARQVRGIAEARRACRELKLLH